MLTEVKYVQNIGRFEKASSIVNAGLGHCTLIFGENGWGKSTLADIFRSLTTVNPAILMGRKTLAGGPEQKAVLNRRAAGGIREWRLDRADAPDRNL